MALMLTLLLCTEADAAWVARMDALAAALTALIPDVVDDKPDPAREERVRRSARALVLLAHDLSPMSNALPDEDPTIALLLRELEQASRDVQRAKGEQLSEAAHHLASTCIGCHTRAPLGPPRPRTQLAPLSTSLPDWLRADVLAATRRFEEARGVYRRVVSDAKLARNEPLVWEGAVRRALVVEVRVARDPRGALEIVERMLRAPASPQLREDAIAWRGSIRRWLNEPRGANDVRALEARASRLMDEALALQRAPDDSAADILFLRATSELHELLAKEGVSSEMRTQAIAWLGLAYGELRDLDPWSLATLYDEACVEAAPHSLLAEECFARFERTTRSDFSGNSGETLPLDMQRRLDRLRALAR